MDWYFYPLVILAGFAAGFINTLAGSGSVIALALLIFMGVPAPIANGSNRVGVLLQSLTSSYNFHKKQALDVRGGILLALPSVIGSFIGAQIATSLNETMMNQMIGGLMIIMLVVILARPKRWLEGTQEIMQGYPTIGQLIIFFFIGIYGGFIQAGVGIFLLSSLVLGAGYNLVRANAIKTFIIFIFTISALGVFIINGQVWWRIGILLAIGNIFGGWLAVRVALERGTKFVRYILIAVIVLSAIRLLFGIG